MDLKIKQTLRISSQWTRSQLFHLLIIIDKLATFFFFVDIPQILYVIKIKLVELASVHYWLRCVSPYFLVILGKLLSQVV